MTELDRFEALLADLLEISRLDAGVADLTADRVDVHGVVTRAVEAVRGFAEESGTPLRLHLPTGVYAEVDPRRVERIVRNLVANAVDHGEGRPVDHHAGRRRARGGRGVRDHGVACGRARRRWCSNVLARRLSPRPPRGGSGWPVDQHRGARLHGGMVAGVGEPGRCSAFRLTLPRDVGGHAEGEPPAARAGRPAASEGSVPNRPPPSSTSDVAAGSVPTPVHASPRSAAASGNRCRSRRPSGVSRWCCCSSSPGSRAARACPRAHGAGAAPRRRRRRARAAPGPRRRQQCAGPGPCFVYASGSSPYRHGPPALPRPEARSGTTARAHGALGAVRHRLPHVGRSEADMRTVRIRGTSLGRLTPGGGSRRPVAVQIDVNVSARDGQWPSRACPSGVLVRMSDVRINYRTVKTWFRGPAYAGSPCRPALPTGTPARAQAARRWSAVRGPSTALQGAASTMLVANAAAAGERRHEPRGGLIVDLTQLGDLDEGGRRLLAAQVVLSLAEVSVGRVRLLADGAPFCPAVRPHPRRRRSLVVAETRAGDGARPGRLRRPRAPAHADSSTTALPGPVGSGDWPCSRRRRARTGAWRGRRKRPAAAGCWWAVPRARPRRSAWRRAPDPPLVGAHRIRGVDGPGRLDGPPAWCSDADGNPRTAPSDATELTVLGPVAGPAAVPRRPAGWQRWSAVASTPPRCPQSGRRCHGPQRPVAAAGGPGRGLAADWRAAEDDRDGDPSRRGPGVAGVVDGLTWEVLARQQPHPAAARGGRRPEPPRPGHRPVRSVGLRRRDLETWRQVVGGAPDAGPLYPGDHHRPCVRYASGASAYAVCAFGAASCAFLRASCAFEYTSLRVRARRMWTTRPHGCSPGGWPRSSPAGGRMATSSPGSVPAGSVVLSRRACSPRLLDLLLPGSCGGCDAPGRAGAPACAAHVGPPLWPCCPVGSRSRQRPVPRRLRSAVPSTRNAGRRDSPAARPPCSSRRWARSRARRVWLVPATVAAVGGTGRGVPAVATTCWVCRQPGAGRPRALRRARAPLGRAGARLRRAGRRGAGGEPAGASGVNPRPLPRRARR